MRRYETRQVTHDVLVEYTCDRCYAKVDAADDMNAQEWVVIGGCGGFMSKYWGDETGWSADLCEKCQHELFSDFARIG